MMNRMLLVIGLFAAVEAGTVCERLPAQDALKAREAARVDTIRRITPSVVCVMAASGEGGGSGVLISADGFAISNYHVTSGSGTFMKCGLSDGRLYDAVITGIDPTGDVALLQLQGRTDFEFATPGNSDHVRTGQEIMALGNPFLLASDFTPTVTFGIVSGVRRYQYPSGTFLEYTDCIQIDASINPGNSGGPLFDMQGRWIGINGRASFEKRGRVNTGAAYAISVNQILLFLEHLRCGLIVDHGITEFTVKTSEDGEVVVSQVSELSEAWRRGLRPEAQILSFAGRVPSSANDLQNITGIFPEGTRLPISWKDRDGVHDATIRLRPLHAFQKAPQLPEERTPRPEPRPDDESHRQPEHEPAEVPAALANLFVAQEGLCNGYYNQLHRQRLLEPLAKRAGSLGERGRTWVLQFSGADAVETLNGELTSTEAITGLNLNDRTYLQSATDPNPDEEPPALPGLLVAMDQLRRLLSTDSAAFDEQLAAGRTHHLPLDQSVAVLLTRQGSVTCRWYFTDGLPLPAGVDVEYGQGIDEARLLLENWTDFEGAIVPSRIGLVTQPSESVRWIEVAQVSSTLPK